MPATILVVDDNPMVREVVQTMLKVSGYKALMAGDGPSALALYASEPADAAIIDIDMPGMDGIEVCRALHAKASAAGRRLLVWMMTGLVRPELVATAEAAGANGVLAKPFTKMELLACFQQEAPVRSATHALAS